jgi:replicative DNA helicase
LDNDKAGQEAQEKLKAALEALNISFYEINTSGEYKDPNEHLMADRNAFIKLVNGDPAEAARQEAEAERAAYLETSAANHITAFIGDIEARANTPAISTGFIELNEALDGGLYEGLYVLGAVSSLGKTSFILQMADQIAQEGQDVLIFSLEMSRYELMAKSISRLTYLNCGTNPRNAKTTRGILAGARWEYYSQDENDLITGSISEYYKYGGHIFIHEGVGNIGVEQIKQEVQKHISFTGNTPVIFIDYLQIIAPIDMRATDKQNVDRAVLELKRLSRDKKTPVFCISSFNRENYSAAVNMTAFKESGAVEYSSDVLIGLQFEGAGEKDFNAKEAKDKDPREVELVILKNRNGKGNAKINFKYFPMFNYFEEQGQENPFYSVNIKKR